MSHFRLLLSGLLISFVLSSRAGAADEICAPPNDATTVGALATDLTDRHDRSACLDPALADGDAEPGAYAAAMRRFDAALDAAAERWRCPGAEAMCGAVDGLRTRAALVDDGLARIAAGRSPRMPNAAFQIDFSQRELLVGTRGGAMAPVQLCRALVPEAASLGAETAAICARHADATCAGPCADRAETLYALLPGINAMSTTASWSNLPAARADVREQRRRADRWHSYLVGDDASQALWPWELVVNGWLHHPQERAPPKFYVSALRPQVGVELYDGDDGNATVSGLVEIVGYNRISYGVDDTRQERWGVSAVLGYGLGDDADEIGYGLQVKQLPRLLGHDGFAAQLDVALLYRDDAEQVSLVFSRSVQSFFDRRPCAYFGRCDD